MCEKVCSNCGKGELYCSGLCEPCYHYQMRHRKPRPERLYNRYVFCKNCKEKKVHGLGLCKACYSWYKRHGTNRPRSRWADKCMNCGNPSIKGTGRKGLCNACYHYRLRTGKPRPKHLHLRYCDCGNVASKRLRTPHGDIDVCEPCYQLEHSYSVGNEAPQAGTFDARRMDYR